MSRKTTVPAVKKALRVLLTAAMPDTKVWRNHTNTNHTVGENVYIGDCKGTREWGQLGKAHSPQVAEDYNIELEVEVLRGGSDSEGTEERLWDLVDLIDNALLDPSIGGVNLIEWGLVEGFDQTAEAGPDGWECRVQLELHVKARI